MLAELDTGCRLYNVGLSNGFIESSVYAWITDRRESMEITLAKSNITRNDANNMQMLISSILKSVWNRDRVEN